MRAATRRARLAVIVLIAAAAPAAARADTTSTVARWVDQVTFNGFVSTSYSYNFNHPISEFNEFRVFDTEDNTFTLDVFELVAQRAVAKPRDSGFRADVVYGSSIPHVSAATGLFRPSFGGFPSRGGDIDLQQAYASYIAPLGSGVRLDFGKFVTHCGLEVIEGYDGWNDNTTHSFLFGYAIPFTHLGVRAMYAATPQLSVMTMVVNGWDVARDNNRSKTVGGQIQWSPGPMTLVANAVWGPERDGNDRDARTLLDGVVTWKVGRRVTLGANGDWGSEPNAVVAGSTATWEGGAGYARIGLTPIFSMAMRGELFRDPEGARTGVGQKLFEGTVTPEFRLSEHMLVRADIRVDRSSRKVFLKNADDNHLVKTQPTVLLNALYGF